MQACVNPLCVDPGPGPDPSAQPLYAGHPRSDMPCHSSEMWNTAAWMAGSEPSMMMPSVKEMLTSYLSVGEASSHIHAYPLTWIREPTATKNKPPCMFSSVRMPRLWIVDASQRNVFSVVN